MSVVPFAVMRWTLTFAFVRPRMRVVRRVCA